MKYKLVNVSGSTIQVDLYDPSVTQQVNRMRRTGPVAALRLNAGESVDILPHFGGSLEKAHASIKHSRQILGHLRPDRLTAFVCDDAGHEVNIERLLSGISEVAETPVVETDSAPVEISTVIKSELEIVKPKLDDVIDKVVTSQVEEITAALPQLLKVITETPVVPAEVKQPEPILNVVSEQAVISVVPAVITDEVKQIVEQKTQEEVDKKLEAGEPLTFTKYTEEQLVAIDKAQLINIAKVKFNIGVNKRESKETIIKTILGAQQ